MTDTTDQRPRPADPSPLPPDGSPRGQLATGPVRLAMVVGFTALFGLLVGLSALAVVLAVVVMIFLHELGHYLTAKWAGMKVTEFFIGFGPRIWSFQRGETEYGFKAIPAGAYVRIIGMNNLEEVPPEDEDRTYRQKSFPRRLSVGLAGSAMHFLQAWVLLIVVFAFMAIPGGRLFSEPTDWFVEEVSPDSAADEAGLRQGDRILSIDGEAVGAFSELRDIVGPRAGDQVDLVVERDGERLALPATIGEREGSNEGLLGVTREYEDVRYGPLEAIGAGTREFGTGMRLGVGALAGFFTPDSLGNFFGYVTEGGEPAVDEPSGRDAPPTTAAPSAEDEGEDRLLSIYGAVRLGADLTSEGWFGLAFFLININIFVGIFNLIPLLPFDGGHVAVATYERVRSRQGRRYHADVARLLPLTYAVVMFIIVLGVTSLYLDIVRPISL